MSAQVLVVGAGPVGLSLAVMLRRQGVSVRVIDQASAPSIYSKAQVIHARTVEIMDAIGVAPRLLAIGRQTRSISIRLADMSTVAKLDILMPGDDTLYPFLLDISQADTERELRAFLAEQGVEVEWQVRLDRFSQSDDGVEATLVHADGAEEVIRAPYMVGCDGAHSVVRKGLGLSFEGSTYDWAITQADLHVDFSVPVPEGEIVGFLTPDGPLGFFPLPGDRRYRVMVFYEKQDPTLEFFQSAVDSRGPRGTVVSDPRWMVSFKINCRMVDRYRVGRVFVAGDAAHIHSPAGGQGMNTGIQDAWNLSWKLALALAGQASEALLDSYDAERRPVAAAVLKATDMVSHGMYTVAAAKHPAVVALRNQFMTFATSLELVRATASRTISELDIGYPGSPVVAGHRDSLWHTRGLGGDDESPTLMGWVGLGRGPAPGSRLPNTAVAGVQGVARIYELLASTSHTLLLFDGPQATDAGYLRLAEIAAQLAQRWGDRVKTRVVVPGEAPPPHVPGELVVYDTQRGLHAAFHAEAECLYLIRPDGYVGFRSAPADLDALSAHLTHIFG